MTELYQCPYDKATKCSLDEPCKGCETWAINFERFKEKLKLSDLKDVSKKINRVKEKYKTTLLFLKENKSHKTETDFYPYDFDIKNTKKFLSDINKIQTSINMCLNNGDTYLNTSIMQRRK